MNKPRVIITSLIVLLLLVGCAGGGGHPFLTPGNQAGPVNFEADLTWITHALPFIGDVLVGSQLSNEPWGGILK